ncbi:DUF4082 domain-containing protein [Lentzea albida]|uniref:DUF4082 domain-containing protein n=1 Tax=Lentzea albida TaxID=65499 RepID=A0A1H9VHY4_9PSEU|nr:DUF4082 domain-containing protein [Lentzea albida]SES21141.1 protein of unknown function [Lentzea albida]
MADYSIWPASDGPLVSFDDGIPLNVGTEFLVSTTAWVTHLRWWRGTIDVSPDNLRLYRVDSSSTGTVLAEVIAPAASGTGWQVSAITPVQIAAGIRYKTVVHVPGHYTATGGYWNGGPGAGGVVNGILTAPNTANANGGGQGTFKTGPPAFPDGSFNGGNYWADVVVTDVDPNDELPEPDPPDEVFTAGRIASGWAASGLNSGWTPGDTRTGWTAGELI